MDPGSLRRPAAPRKPRGDAPALQPILCWDGPAGHGAGQAARRPVRGLLEDFSDNPCPILPIDAGNTAADAADQFVRDGDRKRVV